MSGNNAKMMHWAFDMAAALDLDPGPRLVLVAMASFSDFETGKGIAVSQTTLEYESGVKDRHVRRCIDILWDAGLLDGGDRARSYRGTKVYDLVLDDARRMELAIGRGGPKTLTKPKRRLWGKVEKPVDKPVENEPAVVTTPDMMSIDPGHDPGHDVRQPVNLKKINQEPATAEAVPASQEVVDHAAVAAAFKAGIRERRMAKREHPRKSSTVDAHPAAPARTSSEAQGQSSPAGMQSQASPSPVPAIPQPALPVDPAPARPQAQAPAEGSAPAPAGSSPAAEPASAPRVPSAGRSVPVPAHGTGPVFAVPASFLRLPGLSPSAVPRAPRTDTRQLLGTGCR